MEIAGHSWQLLTQTKNVSPAKPFHGHMSAWRTSLVINTRHKVTSETYCRSRQHQPVNGACLLFTWETTKIKLYQYKTRQNQTLALA